MTHLSIDGLSIFPAYCVGVVIAGRVGPTPYTGTGAGTTVRVSWDTLTVSLNLFDATKSLVHVELLGLRVGVEGLRWADALHSSPAEDCCKYREYIWVQ